MGGAEDFGGKAAPQVPEDQPQATEPAVTVEDLLQRGHTERRQSVHSRLGSLLADQTVYYYRDGDSSGTQG